MEPTELLRTESVAERIYRSEGVYIDAVARAIGGFQRRYPDGDWKDHCRLVSGTPGNGEYQIALRHFVRWGSADASLMERHWGIKLPPWIHEFYSQVSEAVFLWRNLIRVMPPVEVIRNEDEQRSWDGGGGLPIRLIRFAVIWLTGSHLALRQSVEDGRWRIMYVSGYDTTESARTPARMGMMRKKTSRSGSPG